MLKRVLYDLVQKHRKKRLRKCGQNVRIGKNCNLQGFIECGNDISIGKGAYFVSTGAKLHIHDHVVFGPNVTIYTGDHPTNVIGKHICEITDNDKKSLGGGVRQRRYYRVWMLDRYESDYFERCYGWKRKRDRSRCCCDERHSAVFNLCGSTGGEGYAAIR